MDYVVVMSVQTDEFVILNARNTLLHVKRRSVNICIDQEEVVFLVYQIISAIPPVALTKM